MGKLLIRMSPRSTYFHRCLKFIMKTTLNRPLLNSVKKESFFVSDSDKELISKLTFKLRQKGFECTMDGDWLRVSKED